MRKLPQTGTADLLEVLSPHLDDEFVNGLFAGKKGRGRRSLFQPSQLFRVQLLGLLTPAHSFNLLVKLLAENRAWRDFALLRNRRVLPDARMLHEFRHRLDLARLRAVNRHLLTPLLEIWEASRKSVAIIDSTDLPAATHSFKKNQRKLLRSRSGHWREDRQKRAESLVYRLQKTQLAFVDSPA